MKKVVLSVLLVIVMCFTWFVPAFASTSPYEELQEKGFPAEYLDALTDDFLLKLCNELGDNDVDILSFEIQHLKETGSTTTVQPYGNISKDDMDLYVLAAAIYSSGTNKISGVLVTVNWEWKDGKPFFRLNDSISINWDSSVLYLASDGFYSRDKWRLTGINDGWVTTTEYTSPAVSNQGGVGYYTDLAYDANFNTDPGGDTMLILDPCSPMYRGSNNGTSINVNYVHNKILLTPSLSFSKSGPSVNINGSIINDSASDTANIRYS